MDGNKTMSLAGGELNDLVIKNIVNAKERSEILDRAAIQRMLQSEMQSLKNLMMQEVNMLKHRLSKCENLNSELLTRIEALSDQKVEGAKHEQYFNSNYETNQMNTKAKKPQSLGTNAILKSKIFNQALETVPGMKVQPKKEALAKFTNQVIDTRNNLNMMPTSRIL